MLISVLVMAVFTSGAARAIGLSVTPPELVVGARRGEEIVERIVVSNPSNEVALFEVYPDEFELLVKVMPASFVLESGEEKNVFVRIEPRQAGQFVTAVSIVAYPLSQGNFNAASGVKVPVRITVSDSAVALPGLIFTFVGEQYHRMIGIFLFAVVAASSALVVRSGITKIKGIYEEE